MSASRNGSSPTDRHIKLHPALPRSVNDRFQLLSFDELDGKKAAKRENESDPKAQAPRRNEKAAARPGPPPKDANLQEKLSHYWPKSSSIFALAVGGIVTTGDRSSRSERISQISISALWRRFALPQQDLVWSSMKINTNQHDVIRPVVPWRGNIPGLLRAIYRRGRGLRLIDE
jgi:hypothetical protein